MLTSTLAPRDVLQLLGQPLNYSRDPELLSHAYAQLYDKRGGAIEIEFKEDKQGFGMNKRNKKKAEAQEMLVLLNTLAHNVLVWARGWLFEKAPQLKGYRTLRFVRDLMSISGVIELDRRDSSVRRITLNRAASLARGLLGALRQLLLREQVALILDHINDIRTLIRLRVWTTPIQVFT